MKLLKKTMLGGSIILVSSMGFCAKKAPIDLGLLPSIPGTPMTEGDFQELVENVVSGIPKEFAIFDGKKMMLSEVEPQIRAMMKNPKTKKGGKEQMKKISQGVCKSALEKAALMKLAADHSSYKVITDEEFKNEFDNLVTRYHGEKELRDALKKDGVSFERFQKIVKNNLQIRHFINSFRSEIQVDDKAVEVEYNKRRSSFNTPKKVKASHILKKIPKGADETIKATLKSELKVIIDQLKQGADFSELAKKESDCPSGKKGGSLGSFTKGRMVKPFSDAAFAMEEGEISGIVETQFGYHIIKCDGVEAPAINKLADVKPKILKELQSRQMNISLKEAIQNCLKTNGGKLLF